MEVGKPLFFNVDVYLAAAEMMINSDEVERALWMLDNMPAYYRENPPKRAIEIREALHRQLFTSVQYRGIYKSVNISPEHTAAHWPLRAQILEDIVAKENANDSKPHIMELAPGSFFIPEGLKHKGRHFTYEHKSIDDTDYPQEEPAPGAKIIFCAFEIIEHLANEWEIYQNYLKFQRPSNSVLISTPLFTFAGGLPDWETRPLGHLRTYTPNELHKICAEMFPNREWTCNMDSTIVFRGDIVGAKN